MASTWMLRMRYSCFAKRFLHVVGHQRLGGGVVRRENEVVDAAAHSGRICRSPSAVPMMMRTDSSMLVSYRLSWTAPFGPTEKGNLSRRRGSWSFGFSVSGRYAVAIPTSNHALAVGAAHHRMALLLFDLQPVGALHSGRSGRGRPALTASMSRTRRIRVRPALFGVLVHVAKAPSFDAPERLSSS